MKRRGRSSKPIGIPRREMRNLFPHIHRNPQERPPIPLQKGRMRVEFKVGGKKTGTVWIGNLEDPRFFDGNFPVGTKLGYLSFHSSETTPHGIGRALSTTIRSALSPPMMEAYAGEKIHALCAFTRNPVLIRHLFRRFPFLLEEVERGNPMYRQLFIRDATRLRQGVRPTKYHAKPLWLIYLPLRTYAQFLMKPATTQRELLAANLERAEQEQSSFIPWPMQVASTGEGKNKRYFLVRIRPPLE